MLRSLQALVTSAVMYVAQALSVTSQSSSVDTAGFGSLCLQLVVGTFTFTALNKVTVTIEHCDDNATWVQCGAGDLKSCEGPDTGVFVTLNAVAQQNSIYHADYIGSKRYVRAVLTVAGTVSAIVAVNAVKGHPLSMPLR